MASNQDIATMPKPSNARVGKESSISTSLVDRAARGLTKLIVGADTAWFGPNQPLPPVAQEVAGRGLDYAVGLNIQYQPKIYDNDTGISYPQLRGLSESSEIIRLCIETRKDQMEGLSWSIKPKDETKEADARCDKLEAFFEFPDQRRPWKTWLRMLLEDLLVIDAPAIYPRKTLGGQPYAFEIMDGSMFKVLIQPDGRVPVAPQPAYQQILHGVPAVDYSVDELIYSPRNPRPHRLYGFSPVEQIIVTANTAIRRSITQLKYYTSGTIPEGFMESPASWTTEMIAKFQNYLDSMMAGDLDRRNQAFVVPNGMKFNPAKQPVLTDEMDAWLTRIICYAFSLPPTPFIKQMNRATAQNATEQAAEEGMKPLMDWVKALIDYILRKYFGVDDLEFVWDHETDTDPFIQAQIDQILSGNKPILTVNEIRAERGFDRIEGGDELAPTPQPGMNPDDEQEGQGKNPNGKSGNGKPSDGKKQAGDEAVKVELAKSLKKKVFTPLSNNTRALKQAQRKLASTLTKFLAYAGRQTIPDVIAAYEKITKAEDDENDQSESIVDQLDMDYFDDMPSKVRVTIQAAAVEGGSAGLKQLGVKQADITAQVHREAVKFANDRAAEMIGRKWVDGELVDNPDAEWVISESTRDFIRQAVEDALQQGWSSQQLADAIETKAFSPERALKIARTEIVNANVSGNMIAWRESGVVVGKQWILGENPCDICKDNADAGPIPINKNFPSGDDHAPAHPYCECDIIPITDPKELETE